MGCKYMPKTIQQAKQWRKVGLTSVPIAVITDHILAIREELPLARGCK